MTSSILLRDIPPGFETSRLIGRRPEAGDGAQLHEAVAASLPQLRAALAAVPWVAAEPSVEASEAYCRTGFAEFHARRDFPFLLFEKEAGRLVGACGLHRPDWAVPKLEIGYWCRTDRTGRGYITEAASQLMRYGYEELGALRLEIIVDESNARSRRIAERIGFGLEGILRSHRRAPDGALRNICIYARLAGQG